MKGIRRSNDQVCHRRADFVRAAILEHLTQKACPHMARGWSTAFRVIVTPVTALLKSLQLPGAHFEQRT